MKSSDSPNQADHFPSYERAQARDVSCGGMVVEGRKRESTLGDGKQVNQCHFPFSVANFRQCPGRSVRHVGFHQLGEQDQ